ncbi:MAG TPA: ATP synthase subunit I [Thermodesulfobacteriota bacterium]|nr:ATP synthase subunit I [Thermodesulfobacteriota bacterium]
MPSKTLDAKEVAPRLLSAALIVAGANLFVGIIGFGVSVAINRWFAISFAAGLFTGIFNLYLYFRILKKGLSVSTRRMERFMATRYAGKFLLIMAVFTLFIWILKLNPLALIAGFVGTVMTTTITMVFIANREYI